MSLTAGSRWHQGIRVGTRPGDCLMFDLEGVREDEGSSGHSTRPASGCGAAESGPEKFSWPPRPALNEGESSDAVTSDDGEAGDGDGDQDGDGDGDDDPNDLLFVMDGVGTGRGLRRVERVKKIDSSAKLRRSSEPMRTRSPPVGIRRTIGWNEDLGGNDDMFTLNVPSAGSARRLSGSTGEDFQRISRKYDEAAAYTSGIRPPKRSSFIRYLSSSHNV